MRKFSSMNLFNSSTYKKSNYISVHASIHYYSFLVAYYCHVRRRWLMAVRRCHVARMLRACTVHFVQHHHTSTPRRYTWVMVCHGEPDRNRRSNRTNCVSILRICTSLCPWFSNIVQPAILLPSSSITQNPTIPLDYRRTLQTFLLYLYLKKKVYLIQ